VKPTTVAVTRVPDRNRDRARRAEARRLEDQVDRRGVRVDRLCLPVLVVAEDVRCG
jgi:hypothetical protein